MQRQPGILTTLSFNKFSKLVELKQKPHARAPAELCGSLSRCQVSFAGTKSQTCTFIGSSTVLSADACTVTGII